MEQRPFRSLFEGDLEAIMQLENSWLKASDLNSMEIEMASWTAPWRKESLAHYLSQGWCFGIYDSQSEQAGPKEALVAFALAQPLLFFAGHTQCLWVEHLGAANRSDQLSLVDIAIRYSRDKHLQGVLLKSDWMRQDQTEQQAEPQTVPLLSRVAQNFDRNLVFVKTTKA